MSRLTQNKKYLRELIAPMLEVPKEAAAQIAMFTLDGVLEATHYDSGQAAWNWHLVPYQSAPTYQQMEIAWGYGEHQPTAPVGWKWSGGVNRDSVERATFEERVSALVRLQSLSFDGISVYNPIQEGGGNVNFAPGDDTNYFYYALGDVKVELAAILTQAKINGYLATAAKYTFLRVK